MIVEVNEKNLHMAATIHSESWKDSHKSFCSQEFIDQHTVENQKKYLQQEIERGKKLYLREADMAVGIISIKGNLIENLYVKPEEQGKGHGTALLKFALDQCVGTPTLWVLSNNQRAYRLYVNFGFRETGKKHLLSEVLSEIEMKWAGP